MSKKSRQKFKYLENEKSFEDEIKSIFHYFWRTIKANKKNFWGWEPDFKAIILVFKFLPKVVTWQSYSKRYNTWFVFQRREHMPLKNVVFCSCFACRRFCTGRCTKGTYQCSFHKGFKVVSYFEKIKSSHRRCSVTKVFLKMSHVSQENTCDGEIVNLQAWNFIKKELKHRCFLVKFAKLLKTSILKNICERLLLENLTNKF